jgi:DNA-binding ferritin-like protein
MHHQNSKHLFNLLSILHSAEQHYELAHWKVCGDSFYGDHLLFERLYDNISDETDALAERLVGLCGHEVLHESRHLRVMYKFMDKWKSVSDCPFRRSLYIERSLVKFIEGLHRKMDQSGDLTLGLEDLLAGLASQHETHLYLIQQRLK